VGVGGGVGLDFSPDQMDVMDWVRQETFRCLRGKKAGLILNWDVYDGTANLWLRVYSLLERCGALLSRDGKILISVGKGDAGTVHNYYRSVGNSRLHLVSARKNPAKQGRDLGVVHFYSSQECATEMAAVALLSEVKREHLQAMRETRQQSRIWPEIYQSRHPFLVFNPRSKDNVVSIQRVYELGGARPPREMRKGDHNRAKAILAGWEASASIAKERPDSSVEDLYAVFKAVVSRAF